MDLGSLLGGAVSVASGGIFGVLGSVIGVGAKWLQERQRQKWEEKKWSHEIALQELNMQARAQETEQELAIVSQEGSWQGLSESVRADAAVQNTHKWVNDVRALFRLILTAGLWILAAVVFYKIVGGSLTEWIDRQTSTELVRYMVYTVFFCASSATMWWFGDRALTPPGMKNR